MAKSKNTTRKSAKSAAAHEDFVTQQFHQRGKEIQKFGTVTQDLPHPLKANVRQESCKQLNLLLANSITLRDMYKKHHWQVAGPTFYPIHLLFDKHFNEQVEIVDKIAERIQLLGGISVAMGGDVAQMTTIPAPPKGREELPTMFSRLLMAHKTIMENCLKIADAADDAGDQGTNDLAVSDVLRPNELQSWFVGQHLVEMPLLHVE